MLTNENVSWTGNGVDNGNRSKRPGQDSDWLASDGSMPSTSQSAPPTSQSAAVASKKRRLAGNTQKESSFETELEEFENQQGKSQRLLWFLTLSDVLLFLVKMTLRCSRSGRGRLFRLPLLATVL